ncbi:MAG: hypothetical protein JO149_05635 [Gammaproteobacteria bacterium]|nr:hypothetical protein [Gammaproteobacteria bacterium]
MDFLSHFFTILLLIAAQNVAIKAREIAAVAINPMDHAVANAVHQQENRVHLPNPTFLRNKSKRVLPKHSLFI